MNINRAVDVFRPNVSRWSIAITFVLLAAIATNETLLFFGQIQYALWSYTLLLVGLSLAPLLRETETALFQAFILLPVFRLVNLTMPVFIELSLFWLPLIYGPFIPAIAYLGRWGSVNDSEHYRDGHLESDSLGHELPWWLGGNRSGKIRQALRRGWQFLAPPQSSSRGRVTLHWAARAAFICALPLVLLACLIGLGFAIVYLAEFEYDLIRPAPLVPSLTSNELVMLTVVMIGFVGFVEELLFRGILQKVLERRLGLVPGLVLASGIFGAMHSGYGVQMEIVFAVGVGLLLGIVYDATDSIVLVSVMHGLLNVLVFGIIPLDGGSSIDLLRANAIQLLQQYDIWWLVKTVLDQGAATGVL